LIAIGELDAGGFKGGSDHCEARALGRGFLVLKISNRDSAHLSRGGKVVLVPFEQSARGATLSWGHK
jgi:hypothetical protein